MEQHESSHMSTAGRPRRPESSASSHSRFTPQSSNSSSANLAYRDPSGRSERDRTFDTDRGTAQESSSEAFLRERIREKRATRLSERQIVMDVETRHVDRVVAQSSPITGGLVSRGARDRDTQRPTSSGKASGERTVSRKGMGVKEMEEVGQSSTIIPLCITADTIKDSLRLAQTEFRPQIRIVSST